ncbi:unnamed protein product [Brassica napus]|uniref:(rape) hypothetical protein n=1 Tax=Brassica napus TaxID=3708 RepID=A0A816J6A8_BRANA|nr:unnamed protein product [Brassica napus]
MTREALSSNGLLNFVLSETLSATSFKSLVVLEPPPENDIIIAKNTVPVISHQEPLSRQLPPASRGVGKKPKPNRSKPNQPKLNRFKPNRAFYITQLVRVLLNPNGLGDQASIVGGAIDFIKELEQQLLSLEAQKLHKAQTNQTATSSTSQDSDGERENARQPCSLSLSHFFLHSYDPSQENRNGTTSSVRTAMEDLEVTLIETHANIKILSRRRGFRWTTVATTGPPQLLKLMAALQSVSLSVVHLSVTTLDTFAIYSISTKVEDSCPLSSVDDIAGAVHHMLSIIEEESFCCSLVP